MTIVNETVYNDENIGEAVKILTGKYKIVIACSIVIFVIMACYLIYAGSPNLAFIPGIGIVFVGAIGAIRIKSYKKMLMQRLQVVNHQDEISVKYEIDDEKMIVTSPNGINTLYYSDIKKASETKSSYLIVYSGGVFVILAKDGFKDNAENEFKKLIFK